MLSYCLILMLLLRGVKAYIYITYNNDLVSNWDFNNVKKELQIQFLFYVYIVDKLI